MADNKKMNVEMLVIGSEQSTWDFLTTITFNWPFGNTPENINGDTHMRIWGKVFDYCMWEDDPKFVLEKVKKKKYTQKALNALDHLSMRQRSQLFECLVEIYSHEEESVHIEHVIYKNGEIIKSESFNTDEIDGFENYSGGRLSDYFSFEINNDSGVAAEGQDVKDQGIKRKALSDKIVASYVEGFSGVCIYCTDANVDSVASDFKNMFGEAWNNAMDELEEDYDAVCVEKEEEIGNPASIKKEGANIVVTFEPLSLMLNEGARADNDYGPDALKNTLKTLTEKYPDISYEGLIAYEWSDEHSGDVVNEEISSGKTDLSTKTYGFVRDTLAFVFNDDLFAEEFWEKMDWQLEDADEDDYKEIMNNFLTYQVPEEAIETLLEKAEEYDDELREELEEMMSGETDEGEDDWDDEEEE